MWHTWREQRDGLNGKLNFWTMRLLGDCQGKDSRKVSQGKADSSLVKNTIGLLVRELNILHTHVDSQACTPRVYIIVWCNTIYILKIIE